MGFVADYPPSYSSTYVKATSTASSYYYPWFATDPSTSLTGSYTYNAWLSVAGTLTNQKFNIDIGSANVLERIYLENVHDSGGSTDRGIRNFSVYGTNSSTAFDNRTYSDTTNLTLLGTFEAQPHVASDVSDPQYFLVDAQGVAYRYYVLRIANNWGSTYSMGIRHIELQVDDGHGSGSLTLKPLTINAIGPHGRLSLQPLAIAGEGGGTGNVALQPLAIEGEGGGSGSLALQSLTASGVGGGTAYLLLQPLTIAASGRESNIASLAGTLPYTLTGSMALSSNPTAVLAGKLPYTLSGGFIIARNELAGVLPYNLSGGFALNSEILVDLSGQLPYRMGGGMGVASHAAVAMGGQLGYILEGGFEVERGTLNIIGGTLPYQLTGGFSLHDVALTELAGELPYSLGGGFTLDGGGAVCGGVMQYREDTTC